MSWEVTWASFLITNGVQFNFHSEKVVRAPHSLLATAEFCLFFLSKSLLNPLTQKGCSQQAQQSPPVGDQPREGVHDVHNYSKRYLRLRDSITLLSILFLPSSPVTRYVYKHISKLALKNTKYFTKNTRSTIFADPFLLQLRFFTKFGTIYIQLLDQGRARPCPSPTPTRPPRHLSLVEAAGAHPGPDCGRGGGVGKAAILLSKVREVPTHGQGEGYGGGCP